MRDGVCRKETASITCFTRRRLPRTGCLSTTTGVYTCADVHACVSVSVRTYVNLLMRTECMRAPARVRVCVLACMCTRADGWRSGDRRRHTPRALRRGSRACRLPTQTKPRACCRTVFIRMAFIFLPAGGVCMSATMQHSRAAMVSWTRGHAAVEHERFSAFC